MCGFMTGDNYFCWRRLDVSIDFCRLCGRGEFFHSYPSLNILEIVITLYFKYLLIVF